MIKKYRTPFLKEVIVRLDFSYPITKLSKALPQDLRDLVIKSFPISEPREYIGKELRVTKDATKETIIEGTNWLFHGIDRQKTLIIGRDNVNISYTKYDSFDVLKQEFLPVVENLFKSYDDLQGKRLGLRYKNEITLSESNLLDWTNYLNKDLLTNLSFPEDTSRICRALSNLELIEEDIIVRFQYGMLNPDYPAPIRKKSFILDYDAYHNGALNLGDINPKLDKSNIAIKSMFERSILDGLRSLMGVEADGKGQ